MLGGVNAKDLESMFQFLIGTVQQPKNQGCLSSLYSKTIVFQLFSSKKSVTLLIQKSL